MPLVPSFVTLSPFGAAARDLTDGRNPQCCWAFGMTGVGFEPTTYGLKVRCSAS